MQLSLRKAWLRFAATAAILSSFTLLSAAGLPSPMSRSEAVRLVGGLENYDTDASVWIWADKQVYQPGESFTLKWTIRSNDDRLPFTIILYRQNNQTGARTYVPRGTSEPSDILGIPERDGYGIIRLPDIEKGTLIGAGSSIGVASASIPNEPGMHTFVLQLRDWSGTRVIKSAYFKFGVVERFETLTGDITSNRTLTNNVGWRISGGVFVKNNATLTVEPGTIIQGLPGSQPASALFITQSGRIMAKGTRARPIIMTSSQPLGDRKAGDWGGLILLGRAPTNWPGGTGFIEGLPNNPDTVYGGNDPDHDCGTLEYVRVEFAGAEFNPNNELNAITWGGCGKKTVSRFLQTTYGFDDAFEWFGGNNDAKYLVGTYARDDYLDGQIGWTGRVQHAVVLANLDNSNRGIEMDNNETNNLLEPFSNPQFYNVTFVGAGANFDTSVDEGASVAAVWLRRGTRGVYNNMIAYNWVTSGIAIADANTQTQVNNNQLTIDGLLLWDNGKYAQRANTPSGQTGNAFTAEWLTGARGTSRNVLIANPLLRKPFDYSNPDFRPAFGSPVFSSRWIQPPDDGFFDQWATYIGAFGSVDWTEEWTNFLQEQDLK
jgi:hypothetical protein